MAHRLPYTLRHHFVQRENMAEETAEQQAPKKKGKLKFIIIAVVVLGLAAGGFFAFKKFAGKSASADDHEGKKKEEVASVLKLDPFVVNLADPGGMRYLRVEMSIGLSGELGSNEGKKEKGTDPVLMSQIRDAIVQMLSAKHSEDLLTAEGKKDLREEINKTVSPFITQVKVTGVFFTDFMVQ